MSLQLNLKTIDDALRVVRPGRGISAAVLLILATRDEEAFLNALRFQWPGYPGLPDRLATCPGFRFAGVPVVLSMVEYTVIVDYDLTIRRVF